MPFDPGGYIPPNRWDDDEPEEVVVITYEQGPNPFWLMFVVAFIFVWVIL